MPRLNLRRAAVALLVAVPLLAVASGVVAVLQHSLGVPNPSAVYLIAVVAAAFLGGPIEAILIAIASALIYNFLFTEPRFSFAINDPGVWLHVLLLLFVGIVVGQLAALQRARAETARAREREARALFKVSRALATRDSTAAVLPEITGILRREADMARVWVALGADEASERALADSGEGERHTLPGLYGLLRRTPGDEPATWTRIHQPGPRRRLGSGLDAYRVRIEAGDISLGSVWALRASSLGQPDRTDTRLLAAAADQIGQALAHDRLASESRAAEIARQSDALKSALLQSVSHDLRTPLATIRAAAGTLRSTNGVSERTRVDSADAIGREVDYLNRLVSNLLDLSRIEAGVLLAEQDVFELDDVLGRALDRLRGELPTRPLEVDLAAPPVRSDPVFVDAAFTNLVENVIRHTQPGTAVRVAAAEVAGARVRLTVEDAGPGVPPEAIPRLFEKFYTVGERHRSRPGTGIGLAVVQGLIEAAGGSVSARVSQLGGLAIDVDLPLAPAAAAAK